MRTPTAASIDKTSSRPDTARSWQRWLPGYCSDDAAALVASGHDDAPQETMARRRGTTIGLVGMGRLGVLLAHTLVCAGVGSLRLDDPRSIELDDIGMGALRPDDVGARRAAAAAAGLSTDYPATHITVGNVGTCDLVVLTSAHVTNPTGTARLICERVPHLTVTHGPVRSDVGPLVLPGRTACVNCIDLHRADSDAAWPQTWRALRRASVTDRSAQPALLALMAAAQAATSVLTAIDEGQVGPEPDLPHRLGTPHPAWGPTTSTTTTLPSLTVVHERWTVHPRCGCTVMAPLPDDAMPEALDLSVTPQGSGHGTAGGDRREASP